MIGQTPSWYVLCRKIYLNKYFRIYFTIRIFVIKNRVRKSFQLKINIFLHT